MQVVIRIIWVCFVGILFSSAVFASEANTLNQRKLVTVGLPMKESQSSLYPDSQSLDHLHRYLKSYWLYWAEEYNYSVQFVEGSYRELVWKLDSKQIDVIASTAVDRSKTVHSLSIPFGLVELAVFERVGEPLSGDPVALDLPSQLVPSHFNNRQEIVVHQSHTQKVMSYLSQVNFFVSWNVAEAERQIRAQGFGSQFVRIANDSAIALRAMTRSTDIALLMDINRGIRRTPKSLSESLWKRATSNHPSGIVPMVGKYYKDISLEQESLLARSPIWSYAYVVQGEEPYFIADGFEMTGYTVDVLNALSKRLGVTFQGKPYHSFQDALQAVKQGEVDIFPGVYKTKSRSALLAFTTDIDRSSAAIISEKDYYALNELVGQKLVLVHGQYENVLIGRMLPRNPVIYVDTANDAIKAVAMGRADAYVGKLLNSLYLIEMNKLYGLKVHVASDIEDLLWPRIATSKSRAVHGQLLNLGLHTLGDDFQKKLASKWVAEVELGYRSNQSELFLQRTLILAGLIIIFGAAIYFISYRQIKKREKVQQSLEIALDEAKAARQEALAQANAKTNFLARMSHEIRTPMNGVLGMSEALSFTDLKPEQAELLKSLNSSARNLMALLNDVLDFSKMDAGKLTLERIPANLHELVKAVIGNFQHRTSEKDINVIVRIDERIAPSYLCDSTRLMQVLNNLVSNAVKFTEQGEIEVSLFLIDVEPEHNCASEYCDKVRIQVRDSGIGIASDKLDDLFKPFVQADSDITRRFGGTGLGLSICKEIIEEMRGEIKASSIEGRGSLFQVTLPMCRHEVAAVPKTYQMFLLSKQRSI